MTSISNQKGWNEHFWSVWWHL